MGQKYTYNHICIFDGFYLRFKLFYDFLKNQKAKLEYVVISGKLKTTNQKLNQDY